MFFIQFYAFIFLQIRYVYLLHVFFVLFNCYNNNTTHFIQLNIFDVLNYSLNTAEWHHMENTPSKFL